MSLKNKLATYTALAGILAGSVGFGGFGCEKRSLEGKLNQIGVQATQPATQAYGDPVLTRVLGKLKEQYEKFNVSQLSECDKKIVEEEIKRGKPDINLTSPPSFGIEGRLEKDKVIEFYRKAGFVNIENPTKKDLAFIYRSNYTLGLLLEYQKYKKDLKKVREKILLM